MSTKLSIAASVTAIAAVAAAIGGGTYATYSNTEKQVTPTKAGTLDINLDGVDDGKVSTFSISKVQPGDSYSRTITVNNTGDLNGTLVANVRHVTRAENDCNEAEKSAGDTTCVATGEGGVTPAVSELGAAIQFWVQRQEAGGNLTSIYGTDDPASNASVGTDLTADELTGDAGSQINAGASRTYVVTWKVPKATTGVIQSDSVSFDLQFVVSQIDGQMVKADRATA